QYRAVRLELGRRLHRQSPGALRQRGNFPNESVVSFCTVLVLNDRRARARRTPSYLATIQSPLQQIAPPWRACLLTTTLSPPIPPTGSLLQHVSESVEGIDLRVSLRDRYHEDPFFKNILDNPKFYKNFRVRDGLIFVRERQSYLLCIPNIIVEARNARELVIRHAHSLLAHLGASKTLGLLREHVWWKT
ncbi:hypothetical protein CERSUDRAFT_131412, partial [Gelatoporia subvermispora B]